MLHALSGQSKGYLYKQDYTEVALLVKEAEQLLLHSVSCWMYY